MIAHFSCEQVAADVLFPFWRIINIVPSWTFLPMTICCGIRVLLLSGFCQKLFAHVIQTMICKSAMQKFVEGVSLPIWHICSTVSSWAFHTADNLYRNQSVCAVRLVPNAICASLLDNSEQFGTSQMSCVLQVFYFPSGASSLLSHPGPFLLLAICGLITSFTSTLMFTAMGSFFNRISDPGMGGAYLTLLNTIANMGKTLININMSKCFLSSSSS